MKDKLITYWIYCIGFVDLLAVSVVFPLIPQHAKELGASPSAIGLLGSIYGAIQLFSSPVIGHLGDEHGRAKLLFVCIMVSGFGYMFASTCVWSLILLASCRVISGCFKHTQDLCRNCLSDYSAVGEKTKSISQFNALANFGFIIGPSISGLLSKHFSLSTTVSLSFGLCGFLFLINAAVVWFVIWPNVNQTSQIKHTKEDKSLLKKLREIDWKAHRGLFLFRFLFALAVLLYRSSFILGVKQQYPQLSSAEVGYLLSYSGVLGFVFGIIIGWVSVHHFYKGNEEKLQMHAGFLIPFAFLVCATSSSVAQLMVGMAILSMGTTTARACGVILTTKRSKPDETGKLIGFSSSILSIARSAAPLVSGVAQEFSYSLPTLISLALSTVGLLVYYLQIYRNHVPSKPITFKQ